MSNKKKANKEGGSGVSLKDRQKINRPKNYKVIFYNDDFTPMEYVVLLLIQEFHLSAEKATSVMINIHKKGRDAVGSYSKEIAETKASMCNVLSRQMGYPLLCDIEAE